MPPPDDYISISQVKLRDKYGIYGNGTCGCDISELHVHPNITTIGDGAFHNCNNLTHIYMHNNIIKIGKHAFSHSGITRITIPPLVTQLYNSFSESLINTIIFHDNITDIFNNAFSESMIRVLDFPNSISYIGDSVCKDCRYLYSLTLPNQLQYIYFDSFINTNLSNVTVPSSVTKMSPHAFDKHVILTSSTNISNEEPPFDEKDSEHIYLH